MREPDILCSAMTKLETMLKAYFLQRPELQKRIITSTELSNYISWMASSHKSGYGKRFTVKDIPDFAFSFWHCELAESFLENPNDPKTIALMSKDSAPSRM